MVQFRGLPGDLREFPIIWAIGYILGAPRAVDMKFTKKFGQSRFKVAVLNPDLIPVLVDVVIGDFVYELQFSVEKEENIDEPTPIDMDADLDDGKPEDGDDVMEEDQRKEVQQPLSGGETGGSGAPSLTAGTSNCASAPAKSKPMVLLSPAGVTGTQQWRAELLAAPLPNSQSSQVKPLATPVRASKRTAATNGEDSVVGRESSKGESEKKSGSCDT